MAAAARVVDPLVERDTIVRVAESLSCPNS